MGPAGGVPTGWPAMPSSRPPRSRQKIPIFLLTAERSPLLLKAWTRTCLPTNLRVPWTARQRWTSGAGCRPPASPSKLQRTPLQRRLP